MAFLAALPEIAEVAAAGGEAAAAGGEAAAAGGEAAGAGAGAAEGGGWGAPPTSTPPDPATRVRDFNDNPVSKIAGSRFGQTMTADMAAHTAQKAVGGAVKTLGALTGLSGDY